MFISHITLRNWRNFQSVEIPLRRRMFLVGPNASGKSNFLDALRFLRDIAKSEGGGLQNAVKKRGGVSKIRCLAARKEPQIEIEIDLSENGEKPPKWKYAIAIKQESRGLRQPFIFSEKVWKEDRLILERPTENDEKDSARKKQTHLEQINANLEFRAVAQFLNSIDYLHLIPQVLRFPEIFRGSNYIEDPFGLSFLERVAQTPERTRRSRLRKIETALKVAVPQLKQLSHIRDERGIPHLEAVYEHWRPRGAKQREDQFSDGTLRLIAFLWSILDGDSLLLLEEPELSLHPGVVTKLASLIWRFQNKKKRQILTSTHSADLLADKGIGGDEVLLLSPEPEGTKVRLVSSLEDIRTLLDTGMSIAEVVLPRTEPEDIVQLSLFNE